MFASTRLDFSNLLLRLASFQLIVNSTSVSTLKLAALGLYFDEHQKKIFCCSCQFTYTESIDRLELAIERHTAEYSNCSFIQQHREKLEQTTLESTSLHVADSSANRIETAESSQPTINTTTVKTANETAAAQAYHVTTSKTISESSRRSQSSERNHERGLSHSMIPILDSGGARYPHMSSVEERSKSFRGNEARFQKCLATIKDFSEAGFLYVGPNDAVRCFYCDGGLKNFKPNDDPWSEHQHWFPECEYVKARINLVSCAQREQSQLSANASVSGATSSYQAAATNIADRIESPEGRIRRTCKTISATTTTVAAAAANTAAAAAATSAAMMPKYPLDPRELKARLETPMIQRLISMGYKREHIRTALERRLTCFGDDYPNVSALLEDLSLIVGESAFPSLRNDASVAATSTTCNRNPGIFANQGLDSNLTENRETVTRTITGAVKNTTIQSNSSTLSATAASISAATAAATPATNTAADAACNTAATATVSAAAAAKMTDSAVEKDSNNNRTMISENAESLLEDDEELKELRKEYQELKQARACKICLEVESDTVFLPCGHYCCCSTCAKQISHCCICRSLIRGTVKALSLETS